MEQSNQEIILRNYIERVMSIQNERRQALGLAELKGIARELGMSEEDMMAADRAVDAHIERGLRHGTHGRWEDAVAELSDAVALNPANLRGLFGLAVAHKERWMETGNDADRLRAGALARQVLQLYPDHDPAYLLLNDIEPKTAPPGSSRKGGEAAISQRWIFAIPVLFGVALLLWLFLRPATSQMEPFPPPAEEVPAPPPPAAGVPVPARPDDNGDASLGLVGHGIPIVWECAQPEGMGIELRETYNEVGDTRKLQILIDNTGDLPLHALEIKLEDFDPYGIRIASNKFGILSEQEAPIISGMFRSTFLEYPVVGGMPASYKVSVVAAR